MEKIRFLHKVVFAVLIGCCTCGVSGYFLKTAACGVSNNSGVCCDAPKIEGFELNQCKSATKYHAEQSEVERYCDYIHNETGARCFFSFNDRGKHFLQKFDCNKPGFSIIIDASDIDSKGIDKFWLVNMISRFCWHFEDKLPPYKVFGGSPFRRAEWGPLSYDKEHDVARVDSNDWAFDEETLGKFFKNWSLIKQCLATEEGINALKGIYEALVYKESVNEKGEKEKSGICYEERCKNKEKEEEQREEDKKLDFEKFSFSDFVKLAKLLFREAQVVVYVSGNEQYVRKSCDLIDKNVLNGRQKGSFKARPVNVSEKESRKDGPNQFYKYEVDSPSVRVFVPDDENGETRRVECKYVAYCNRYNCELPMEDVNGLSLKSLLAKFKAKKLAAALGYDNVQFIVEPVSFSKNEHIAVEFYGNDGSKFEDKVIRENLKKLFEMLSEENGSEQDREREYGRAVDSFTKCKKDVKFVNHLKNGVAVAHTPAVNMAESFMETGDPFSSKYFTLNSGNEIMNWNEVVVDVAKKGINVVEKLGDGSKFDISVRIHSGKDGVDNQKEQQDSKRKKLVGEFEGYNDLKENGDNLFLCFVVRALCVDGDYEGEPYYRHGILCDIDYDVLDCLGLDSADNEDGKKHRKIKEEFINGKFKKRVEGFKLSEEEFGSLKFDFANGIKERIRFWEDDLKSADSRLEKRKKELEDMKAGNIGRYASDEKDLAEIDKDIKRETKYVKMLESKLNVWKKNLEKLESLKGAAEFENGVKKFLNYRFEIKEKEVEM